MIGELSADSMLDTSFKSDSTRFDEDLNCYKNWKFFKSTSSPSDSKTIIHEKLT